MFDVRAGRRRVLCLLAGSLALACGGRVTPEPSVDVGGAGGVAAAGGAGGAGGAAAGGNPSAKPPYPAGPYGYAAGNTIDDHGFDGWMDPEQAGYDPDALEKIHLRDFYDPDGSGPTRFLLVHIDTSWDSLGRDEIKTYEQGKYAEYRSQGVEFLGVLFQGIDSSPAKPGDLEAWAKTFSVQFPVVLDPGFWFGHVFSANIVPMHLVIDTSNMKIVDQVLGDVLGQLWSDLDALLAGSCPEATIVPCASGQQWSAGACACVG